MINEFHLFAGIGGGIYGGEILGHQCCGGVEIDKYAYDVLIQRQKDGWMNKFDVYKDIRELNGDDFKGKFDILCGGFPCQAFSHAAHGKNIADKDLWPEMFRFAKESEAPIVFGENVTIGAIEKAKKDLETIGYRVERCRLSAMELNGDHKRIRFWLLAVKDDEIFNKVAEHISSLPRFKAGFWLDNPKEMTYPTNTDKFGWQKRGIGNAQVPMAAATAFRILVNRHINHNFSDVIVDKSEIEAVFAKGSSWIRELEPDNDIFVHTPTTMGNYACPSMQKHAACVKYVRIFGKPKALDAEYLMGFPIGASSPYPLNMENIDAWKNKIYEIN